jgi:hypothetical protein
MSVGVLQGRNWAAFGGGGAVAQTGSFPITAISGVNGALDITMGYVIVGGLCSIYVLSSVTLLGTGDTTQFAMVAGTVPTACRPRNTRLTPVLVTDNGVTILTRATVGPDGAISFAAANATGTPVTFSVTGFTASGSKGLQASMVLTYPL